MTNINDELSINKNLQISVHLRKSAKRLSFSVAMHVVLRRFQITNWLHFSRKNSLLSVLYCAVGFCDLNDTLHFFNLFNKRSIKKRVIKNMLGKNGLINMLEKTASIQQRILYSCKIVRSAARSTY